MGQFSELIYNELNYITNYCINQNFDTKHCDQDVVAILSENIGMIYLGAVITYLQHYGLIKEKEELIGDYEPYLKELYGRTVQYKEALQKVNDLVKLFDRKTDFDNEEKTIDNWRVWIREILSRQNKAFAGEVASFFGVGTLYDERKITNELLEHITKTKDIIKAYKEEKMTLWGKKIWQEDFDSIDSLLIIIKKYKDWENVGQYFRLIYKNADYKIQRVRNFLIISYEFELIKNYNEIIKSEKAENVLSMFAMCLYRLGSDLTKQADRTNNIKEIEELIAFAELSFESSLICDPYCFSAFYGIVLCCMKFKDKEKGTQYYEKFIQVTEELEKTESDSLNYFQRATKDDDKTIMELKGNLLDMINGI